MFGPDPVANMHAASSTLFDVVLLAGGAGSSLFPLTTTTPKALVNVCNRPLVWFAVKPWLDAGVRHMYICAPAAVLGSLELELTNCADFEGASFTFLQVRPTQQADTTSTTSGASGISAGESGGTADAVRSYSQYKRGLPPTNPKSAKRDALVVSCDTVFRGIDVWALVRNFYDGFYSACGMFYEPDAKHDDSGAVTDCLGVEPPCATSTDAAMHLRTHFVMPSDCLDDGQQSLPAGAVARRLNLTYTTAFVDAHVYLLRRWVLEYLDFHRDIASIRYDLLPTLAARQLPTIGPDGLKTPSAKLDASQPIPVPAALGGSAGAAASASSLSRLNALQHINPPAWDELRVCATVFRSCDTARVMRVNTVKAYWSFTEEVLAGLTKPEEATALAALVAAHLQYETARTLQADPAAAQGVKYSGVMSVPAPNVKVAVSLVAKGVEVGEGCDIRHCVLLPGSRVAAGVKLKNVLLCSNSEATSNLEDVVVGPDGELHDFD